MRTFGRGLRVIQSYRQSDSDPLEPEELASALKVMPLPLSLCLSVSLSLSLLSR